MRHPYILAFLISTTAPLVGEDFKLKLDQQAIPTIPMPLKTDSKASTKGEKKPRLALSLAAFTSNLEKDLQNLEAIQSTGTEAARTSALGSASYSAERVIRYLALVRPMSATVADPALLQAIIKRAEDALSDYEKHRTEETGDREK